jgi:FAD:protein FMN transferase
VFIVGRDKEGAVLTMLRDTRLLMGMPITVEIADHASPDLLEAAYAVFAEVEARFSTYRADSEISRINRGLLKIDEISDDMRDVFDLAERTRIETDGFFDARRSDGTIDPSGIVKSWAIARVARLIGQAGMRNYFVDAGGDIQTCGKNAEGDDWVVGIRNPFDHDQIVKAVVLKGEGIATSGTYVRGQHIYNPHRPDRPIDDIVSLTVIGRDVIEADRFATAAFAMGRDGIAFIEATPLCEGYLIDAAGIATFTSGFGAYVTQ